MLKTFKQITSKDKYSAGGKAYSLGRMIKHFSIPNGFVILSDTFDVFLQENKLKNKIKKIIAGDDDFFNKSGKIKELIVSAPLNPILSKKIMQSFAH